MSTRTTVTLGAILRTPRPEQTYKLCYLNWSYGNRIRNLRINLFLLDTTQVDTGRPSFSIDLLQGFFIIINDNYFPTLILHVIAVPPWHTIFKNCC